MRHRNGAGTIAWMRRRRRRWRIYRIGQVRSGKGPRRRHIARATHARSLIRDKSSGRLVLRRSREKESGRAAGGGPAVGGRAPTVTTNFFSRTRGGLKCASERASVNNGEAAVAASPLRPPLTSASSSSSSASSASSPLRPLPLPPPLRTSGGACPSSPGRSAPASPWPWSVGLP